MPTPSTPNVNRSKYLHLADLFQKKIDSKELAPGEQLPSIRDLCRQYKVSLNTVTKVYGQLEKQGLIVREQGRGVFVSRNIGRRPRTGVVGLIGYVYFEKKYSLYWATLLDGVQCALAEQGLQLLLLHGPLRDETIWDKVDGILLCDDMTTTLYYLDILPAHLPRVAMLVSPPKTSCVVADEYGGAYEATRHLISLGHRRIAYLKSEYKTGIARERLLGHNDAMEQAHLDSPDLKMLELVDMRDFMASMDTKTYFYERSLITMRNWLKDGWRKDAITAVVAQNDPIAEGAIVAIQEAGLKVPDDISIIGFDGVEQVAASVPALTTIETPLRRIGVKAVELLMRQIQDIETGLDIGNEKIILPTSLRTGLSTAAPKASMS
jgi:DNA-binding LacI/PurR family transcriptional regulator